MSRAQLKYMPILVLTHESGASSAQYKALYDLREGDGRHTCCVPINLEYVAPALPALEEKVSPD